jgi:hypothetical protein
MSRHFRFSRSRYQESVVQCQKFGWQDKLEDMDPPGSGLLRISPRKNLIKVELIHLKFHEGDLHHLTTLSISLVHAPPVHSLPKAQFQLLGKESCTSTIFYDLLYNRERIDIWTLMTTLYNKPRTDIWTSKTRTKAHIYDPARPSKLVHS